MFGTVKGDNRYVLVQTGLVSLIVATLFIRPRMHSRTVDDATTYSSIIFFLIVFMLFDGFTEVKALVAVVSQYAMILQTFNRNVIGLQA